MWSRSRPPAAAVSATTPGRPELRSLAGMTPALILALALAAVAAPVQSAPPATAPPAATTGEPLPPGAPTDDYQLTAWCYGALKEYLDIYERVKPDLVDI